VVYSEKDGLNLITVVLNSEYNQREKDVLKLLRWAYVNFENRNIIDDETSLGNVLTSGNTTLNIEAYPEEEISLFINKKVDKIDIIENLDNEVPLPVLKGQKLGTVDIILNGEDYKTVDLVSGSGYSDIVIEEDLKKTEEVFDRWWIFIFLIGFYFFVIIFIIIRNLIRPKV
jgi:D-alanyl-D-alanine carboxypeptidase (penicillin-binding protein 5/6)